jgi:predicted metal-dependent hydrolase
VVARSLGWIRRPAPDRGPFLTGPSAEPERGQEHQVQARTTVAQGDRQKAYRPIPPDRRRAALEAGLSAYELGDFFEAHELLEPAWMGTDDLAERALYQGLIKLAAGYVHAVRGNPIGFAQNLRGARAYLQTSFRLNPEVSRVESIDLPLLLMRVEARLTAVAAAAEQLATGRAPLIDLLPEAPPIR